MIKSDRDFLVHLITGICMGLAIAILIVSCTGCSTINEQAIKDQLKDKLPAIGDYVEKPEPVEDGPVDDLDLSTVRWNGKELRNGPITVDLRGATMDRSFIHYDVTIPATWEPKTYNGKPCVAHTCIIYENGGGLIGGRYDHLSKGQTAKVHDNLRGDGYNGLKLPAGRCWVFVAEEDGKERSQVREVER